MTVQLDPNPPAHQRGAGDALVVAARALIAWLHGRNPAHDPAAAIERIAALEELQAAAAGAQLVEIAAFARSRGGDGVGTVVSDGTRLRRHPGIDVAAQVGLAAKISGASATRRVTQAVALVDDLPHTLEVLRAGQLSAFTASLVVSETSALGPAQRRAVDADLAPRLAAMGPRRAATAARRAAIRLDPTSATRRARTARSDRRVSIRPAPDTMSLLTAYLPVEQGIAAHAALTAHAKALRAAGDIRGLGQIMADTAVERLTGQTRAAGVPTEVIVTISADALAGRSDEPAHLRGAGPVPASAVREAIAISQESGAPVWLRRMITDPVHGTATHLDSARRRHTGPLARAIDARDLTCRMPFCDAPIRHHDHVTPWRRHRVTTVEGGQGLCEYHNYAKEQPGWSSRVIPGPVHTIEVVTPTGHTYLSHAPPALGP